MTFSEGGAVIRQCVITGLVWCVYERRTINVDSRTTLVPTPPGVSSDSTEFIQIKW